MQVDTNSKPVQTVATREAVSGDEVARDPVRVIRSGLAGPAVLALSDDNRGGDPYNSTGQHVIIKTKMASQD